jgi:hypothetical protein
MQSAILRASVVQLSRSAFTEVSRRSAEMPRSRPIRILCERFCLVGRVKTVAGSVIFPKLFVAHTPINASEARN